MKRLLILLTALARAATAADDPKMLAGHVHVIFERKCNECHGAHLKKPDGRFGYVLDFKRMAENPDYIIRKEPHKSELFRLIRDGEMPPDDHPKTPPLTDEERTLVRNWIAAGAPHELPAVLPNRTFDPPPASLPPTTDPFKKKKITLTSKNQPAGEIIAQIAEQSGLKIDYTKPSPEPRLSIVAKNLSIFETLEYLALNGNMHLAFFDGAAILKPQ